jgi:hypothetical protein
LRHTQAKQAVTVVVVSFALPVALAIALATALAAPANAARHLHRSNAAPSELALRSVPHAYLWWYQQAAQTCHGLPWPVLAGIGEMESDHGQSTAPGVHFAANFAGAEGPMQFEPETFAAFAVRADRSRTLSPYDPKDAIFTAARMLCDEGARGGSPAGISSALFAYNHADWYPSQVMSWAARYATNRVLRDRAVVHERDSHHIVIVRHAAVSRTPASSHGAASHARVTIPHTTAKPHVAAAPYVSAEPYVAPAPAPTATQPVTAQPSSAQPLTGEAQPTGEAQQLSDQAQQLSDEAEQLSDEAQQLSEEARRLSAESASAQELPTPVQTGPPPIQLVTAAQTPPAAGPASSATPAAGPEPDAATP